MSVHSLEKQPLKFSNQFLYQYSPFISKNFNIAPSTRSGDSIKREWSNTILEMITVPGKYIGRRMTEVWMFYASELYIFQVESERQWKVLERVELRYKPTTVIFVPQTQKIWAGFANGCVVVYDVRTRKGVKKVCSHQSIVKIHLDPINELMVSCSVNGEIRVWGMQDEVISQSFNTLIDHVSDFTVSQSRFTDLVHFFILQKQKVIRVFTFQGEKTFTEHPPLDVPVPEGAPANPTTLCAIPDALLDRPKERRRKGYPVLLIGFIDGTIRIYRTDPIEHTGEFSAFSMMSNVEAQQRIPDADIQSLRLSPAGVRSTVVRSLRHAHSRISSLHLMQLNGFLFDNNHTIWTWAYSNKLARGFVVPPNLADADGAFAPDCGFELKKTIENDTAIKVLGLVAEPVPMVVTADALGSFSLWKDQTALGLVPPDMYIEDEVEPEMPPPRDAVCQTHLLPFRNLRPPPSKRVWEAIQEARAALEALTGQNSQFEERMGSFEKHISGSLERMPALEELKGSLARAFDITVARQHLLDPSGPGDDPDAQQALHELFNQVLLSKNHLATLEKDYGALSASDRDGLTKARSESLTALYESCDTGAAIIETASRMHRMIEDGERLRTELVARDEDIQKLHEENARLKEDADLARKELSESSERHYQAIRQKNAEIDELRRELSEIQKQHKTERHWQKSEISQLKAKNRELRAQLADATSNLQAATEENKIKAAKILMLSDENASLKAQIEQLQGELDEKCNALRNLEESFEALMRENEENKTRIQALENTVADRDRRCASLLERGNAEHEKVRKMKEKLARLQERYDKEVARTKRHRKQLADKKSKLSTLLKISEDARAEITMKNGTINELEASLHDTQELHTQTAENLADTLEKLRVEEARANSAEAELARERLALQAARDEMQKLRDRVEELLNELEAAKAANVRAQAELQELRRRVEELVEQVARLEAQLRLANEQGDRLKEREKDLLAQNEQVRNEITVFREEITRIREELSILKTTLKTVQGKYEETSKTLLHEKEETSRLTLVNQGLATRLDAETARYGELELNLSKLDHTLQDTQAQLVHTKEDRVALQGTNERLQRELDEAEKNSSRSSEYQDRLKADLERLQKELEDTRLSEATLHKESASALTHLIGERDTIAQTARERTDMLQRLRKRVYELEMDNAQYKGEVEKVGGTRDALEAQLAQMKDTLHERVQELEGATALAQKLPDLEERLKEAHASLQHERKANQDTKKIVNSQKNAAMALHAELAKVRQEGAAKADRLGQQLSARKAEIEDLEKAVAELRASLEAQAADADDWKARGETGATQLDAANATAADLNARLRDLEAQLQATRQESTEQQQRIDKMRRQIKRVISENKSLANEVMQKTNENDTFATREDALVSEIVELQKRIDEKDRALSTERLQFSDSISRSELRIQPLPIRSPSAESFDASATQLGHTQSVLNLSMTESFTDPGPGLSAPPSTISSSRCDCEDDLSFEAEPAAHVLEVTAEPTVAPAAGDTQE